MRFYLSPALIIVVFICNHTAFAYDHTYKSYDEILKLAVVVEGHQSSVDYSKLKHDTNKLNKFIMGIESLERKEFDTWSREQQMAFLINAYNALTIRLILDNYPGVTSIKDLGGLFINSPWDKNLFTLFKRETTLNFIEHQLLRKLYKDPRVHFVLVCASRSCPPLSDEAYVPNILDQQLTDATINFMRDPERNRFNTEENKVEISKIFKWYKKDFTKAAGSLNAYVAPLMTDNKELSKLIANKNTRITFLDYDWSLNDSK